jgi:hypothetical protein
MISKIKNAMKCLFLLAEESSKATSACSCRHQKPEPKSKTTYELALEKLE